MKTDTMPFSLMGILNVTPDSFYDGGRYYTTTAALDRARALKCEGAHLIDIGGASSRPGAHAVSVEEECARVIPVIRSLVNEPLLPLCVDTTSSVVAKEALLAGASWVNDISAGRQDPAMAEVVAESGCKIVLMHSRGSPETMMEQTRYGNVADDVVEELACSVAIFCNAGVHTSQIIIDPGVGFAKTAEQNVQLLCEIEKVVAMGFPVVLGTSRKSFIGTLTDKSADERLYGTLGSIAAAFLKGVTLFRVHDVAATSDFLKVMAAIQ